MIEVDNHSMDIEQQLNFFSSFSHFAKPSLSFRRLHFLSTKHFITFLSPAIWYAISEEWDLYPFEVVRRRSRLRSRRATNRDPRCRLISPPPPTCLRPRGTASEIGRWWDGGRKYKNWHLKALIEEIDLRRVCSSDSSEVHGTQLTRTESNSNSSIVPARRGC